jgi:hypothetical protein
MDKEFLELIKKGSIAKNYVEIPKYKNILDKKIFEHKIFADTKVTAIWYIIGEYICKEHLADSEYCQEKKELLKLLISNGADPKIKMQLLSIELTLLDWILLSYTCGNRFENDWDRILIDIISILLENNVDISIEYDGDKKKELLIRSAKFILQCKKFKNTFDQYDKIAEKTLEEFDGDEKVYLIVEELSLNHKELNIANMQKYITKRLNLFELELLDKIYGPKSHGYKNAKIHFESFQKKKNDGPKC